MSIKRHSMVIDASGDFHRLWVGQGLASLGTQVTALVLPLTAIVLLHARPGTVGMLGALLWLPFVALSLPVGVAVDRLARRPFLVVGDAVRAAALGAIVWLAASGHLTVPLLLPLAALCGCGAVLFELACPAYVPGLVAATSASRPLTLMEANTRLEGAAKGAQLGGPVAAGLLVQLLTAPAALLLTAASFLASAVTLSAIQSPEAARPASASRPGADLREGIRVVLSQPYLRALVPVSASYNLFSEWILTVYLVYAVRVLQLPPLLIGLTLAGGTAGALAGALSAEAACRRFGLGASFLAVVILECCAGLLVPLAPAHSPWTLPLLMGAFGVMDFGASLSGVIALSVRQAVTPQRQLGRMTACYRMISYGTIPVGAAAGGWVANGLGVGPGLAIGAVALLTTIAWAARSPLTHVRHLVDLPAPADPS